MKIVAQRIIRSLQYDKKEEVELQKFLLTAKTAPQTVH